MYRTKKLNYKETKKTKFQKGRLFVYFMSSWFKKFFNDFITKGPNQNETVLVPDIYISLRKISKFIPYYC